MGQAVRMLVKFPVSPAPRAVDQRGGMRRLPSLGLEQIVNAGPLRIVVRRRIPSYSKNLPLGVIDQRQRG